MSRQDVIKIETRISTQFGTKSAHGMDDFQKSAEKLLLLFNSRPFDGLLKKVSIFLHFFHNAITQYNLLGIRN